jgi:hypothetical protein
VTTLDEPQPTHGYTNLGQAVHKRTVDHLPARTAYERFNKQQRTTDSASNWLSCAAQPRRTRHRQAAHSRQRESLGQRQVRYRRVLV